MSISLDVQSFNFSCGFLDVVAKLVQKKEKSTTKTYILDMPQQGFSVG